MLRRAWCLRDYRNERIAEKALLVIAKKEVEFEHIAVDVSGLVGVGLRLAKTVASEHRRQREVARHVAQGVYAVLNRFHPKKSLALFMDGSEIMWKAHKTRATAATSKKVESRLSRLPGTPLMQVVEEKISRMMPDNRSFPAEVVFSGTCCDGPVEQKMSAWALDLCARQTFKPTDSLLLVGGSELFLNALALAPFYNVASVVQSGSDFKQTHIQDLLTWLNCGEKAKAGDNAFLARVRTDAVFLYTLAHGASVSELGAVNGFSFADAMDRYLERANRLSSSSSSTSSGSGGKTATGKSGGAADGGATGAALSSFLFSEAEDDANVLALDVASFKDLLERMTGRAFPAGGAGSSGQSLAADTLELALQTHAMLCSGTLPSPRFVMSDSIIGGGNSNVCTVSTLGQHLAQLLESHQKKVMAAAATASAAHSEGGAGDEQRDATNSTTPSALLVKPRAEPVGHAHDAGVLTAAEFTLLSMPTGQNFEIFAGHYAGRLLKPEMAKKITTTPNVSEAAVMIRQLVASAVRPHRCAHFSPSYCWLQNPKTKMWSFAYVDLGVRGRQVEARARRNAEAGATLTVAVASDGPAVYNIQKKEWVPIAVFPFYDPPLASSTNATAAPETVAPGPAEVSAPASAASSSVAKPSQLSLLSWNVMFDRYSGQPTPLGMPGIDWCSTKRYPVLLKLIKECDADVIGLQEVEPQFWDILAADPYIQTHYIFSCNRAGPAVNPWGVLMLAHRRVPVAAIQHHNIPAWSGHLNLMPVIVVDMAHGPVSVAAMHLLAPYTKGHENARAGQDNALKQRMLKTIQGDCVTMGDFNDWPTNEFQMEAGHGYTDAWPELHPKDLGKTMDETNTFAKLKIEEIFFGRADKVFYRSRHLKAKTARLIGTDSVNKVNGNTNAPAYLFPSDHYGIHITFGKK